MQQGVREIDEKVRRESGIIERITGEIEKVIVGQKYLVERLLVGLLADGHVLLEGVPGLAKTLSVKTLAQAIATGFQRIQFTPDLLPADLIGTLVYNPRTGEFTTKKWPIFSNIILADEINRAPAKVQSALLEAMQERQVSIGKETFPLAQPFLVMATQNPIEHAGTYPLPEAQVDRFFLKIFIDYPTPDELQEILKRTTAATRCEVRPAFDPEHAAAEILEMQNLVREVLISTEVERYIIDIVTATRPDKKRAGDPDARLVDKYVNYGSSPRGAQALVLGAKVAALLDGRANVSYEDVDRVLAPALNHRVVLNFEAEADKVTAQDILRRIREEARGAREA